MASWLTWALLSACFAALTAVFAKVGVEKIDPDLATLIRTVVILCVLSFYIWWRAQQQKVDSSNVNADWDDSTNSVVPADVREAAKGPKDTAAV